MPWPPCQLITWNDPHSYLSAPLLGVFLSHVFWPQSPFARSDLGLDHFVHKADCHSGQQDPQKPLVPWSLGAAAHHSEQSSPHQGNHVSITSSSALSWFLGLNAFFCHWKTWVQCSLYHFSIFSLSFKLFSSSKRESTKRNIKFSLLAGERTCLRTCLHSI